MPRAKKLRMVLPASAQVRWSLDNWQTLQDVTTSDTGLGTYIADLPTDQLAPGREIAFTFYWQQEQRWEGTNYFVEIEGDN